MNKLRSASEYNQRDVRQSRQCYLRGDEQSGSASQTDGEQKKKKMHRLHGTEGYEVQISDEPVTLACMKRWTIYEIINCRRKVCVRERVEEDDDYLLPEVMKMQIG